MKPKRDPHRTGSPAVTPRERQRLIRIPAIAFVIVHRTGDDEKARVTFHESLRLFAHPGERGSKILSWDAQARTAE